MAENCACRAEGMRRNADAPVHHANASGIVMMHLSACV
jgi:hypothetical protein